MATNKKIAASVAILCEAFNRKATPATFRAYEIALSDISDDCLDAAATKALIGNREFMPTPGQLRELAITGGVGYAVRAERAWIEFDRAVSQHGPDHSVSFADGLINATVRTVGDWIFCCGRTGDDYGVWLRKQFIETYQRLCLSGASESLRQPLMGNLWRENVIFPDAILSRLKANTGQVQLVATSQPILLPPAAAPKRIAAARPKLPKLELKKANR